VSSGRAAGGGGWGVPTRGACEHGCEFAPVASEGCIPSKFLVPLIGFMWHQNLTDCRDMLGSNYR